jgi:hypothetical protein
MSQLRERWEGVSLPGNYLLQRWVSGDDNTGFFEASRFEDQSEETGPGGECFTVKVMAQSDANGSAQLALWQRTKALEHPSLRRLVDFGRAELDGQIVLYAVMEKADDNLASALAQGPLSEPEAREILDAALSALRYLQDRGLAVAVLDPGHVVAVGDTIKVCTHALKEVPLEAPFRHELRTFWDQISPSPTVRRKAILSEALGDAPEAVEVTATPAAASAIPGATNSSSLTGVGKAADAIPFPPDENPRTAGRTPKWIFVGAAAVVLLILGLNLRRAPDTPAQAGSAAPTPVSTTIVPRNPPAEEVRPGAGPKRSPVKATAPAPAVGKAMWRVIAYTYRTHSAAQHKVDQVNRTNPELAATVFTPREKKGYYLVALGGRMPRDAALRLQKKARAERVAHDAYIQNYLD